MIAATISLFGRPAAKDQLWRAALVLAFAMVLAPAHAQKLLTPVYIKQTTAACPNLASLQYRDQLIREQRTEALQDTNTRAAFSGDCGNAPQGQWMFFDGYNGNYVCLRTRPGADCVWLRREAVGELVEFLPGRTLAQGNKGVTCAQWAPVVDKSRAIEKDIMAKWRAANASSTVGTDLVKGLFTGALGIVTGGSDSRQIDHANACVMYFTTAQERGRRLAAYQVCPNLGANGQAQTDQTEYNSLIKEVALSCLRDQ